MAILPWNPSSAGGGGGNVAGDYTFTQNENNELVLNYKGDPVAMQSPEGSWFKTSVSTGVGSLHLGGNESGGIAHSISSCGQNVGFKNEFSRAAEDDKLFFYPAGWQAVTCDGDERIPPAYTRYTTAKAINYPNGLGSSSVPVQYNFSLSVTANSEIYSIYIRMGEDYTGNIKNSIISNVTGAEIYSTATPISQGEGGTVLIKYKYPFKVRVGDSLQLRLIKDDGTYLKTHSGTIDSSIPWRGVVSANFEDAPIVAPAIGDTKYSYRTTDHEGWILLNGRDVSALTASQRSNLASAGLNWTTIPATGGRTTIATGSGAPYVLGTFGGSILIQRENLPNFTLTGKTAGKNIDHTHGVSLTTGTESAGHTHTSGNLAAGSAGAHTHPNTTPINTTSVQFGGAVSAYTIGVATSSSAGDHTHPITGSTGDRSATHTHSISGNTASMNGNQTHDHDYTTQSINGNVTQVGYFQPYVALSHFVYVGL